MRLLHGRSSALLRGPIALAPYMRYQPRRTLAVLGALGALTALCEAFLFGAIGALARWFSEPDAELVELSLIGSFSRNQVVIAGGIAIVVAIALTAVQAHIASRFSTDPMTLLRDELLQGYLRADYGYQQQERPGELLGLMTTHVISAGMALMAAASAIPTIAVFIVLIVVAAVLHPIGFALALAIVVLLRLVTWPLERLSDHYGRAQNTTSLLYTSEASEAVHAATAIRNFSANEVIEDRLHERAASLSEQIYRAQRARTFLPNVYRLLVIGVLLLGLGLITVRDTSDIGWVSTLILLLLRALLATQAMLRFSQRAAEFQPYVDELVTRIESSTANNVRFGDEQLGPFAALELHDVSFRYNEVEDLTLQDVSMTVKRGERVGVTGPSGGGKSTMMALALGLLEPTSGTCHVNNKPGLAYSAESWTRQVAVVPQDPRLITDTVLDNIIFYRDGIGEADAIAAATAAGIHDEIMSWSDGYQTVVGERGARALSGGQRQRICVARAVVGKPSLLLLDEPTSALGEDATRILDSVFDHVGAYCTSIVVSHRPSALAKCDRIIQVQDGRVNESQPL